MTAEGRTRAQRAGELRRVCTKADVLKIAPKKGRAILWFNFDADGELEPNSMHGSCPNGRLRDGANAGAGNWHGAKKRIAQTWIKKFVDFNANQQDGAPTARGELERIMIDKMAFESTGGYDGLMTAGTALLSTPIDKRSLQWGYSRAIADFRAARRLRPADPYAAMLGVARTHLYLKRFDKAARGVDEVLRLIDEERRSLLPLLAVQGEDQEAAIAADGAVSAVAVAVASGGGDGDDMSALTAARRLGLLAAHAEAAEGLARVIRRFGHRNWAPFVPAADSASDASLEPAPKKKKNEKTKTQQALPAGQQQAATAPVGEEADDDDDFM